MENILVDAKKIGKNFSFLFSENILRLGIGFFLSVWMARHLGPEGYGKFTYVISLINLFLPLYILGSDETIIKLFIDRPQQKSELMGTGALIKGAGALFSVLIINGVAFFLRAEDPIMRNMILVYSIAMSFQVFGIINNYYQSKVEEGKTSLIRNLVLIPISLAKVAFIYLGYSWESFIWLSGLEVILAGVFYLILFIKSEEIGLSWSFNSSLLKDALKLCLPFLVVIFLEQSLFKIDQIMVGEILGDQVLGQYGAANKLINLWNFVPLTLLSSVYPLLVKGFSTNKEQYFHHRKILFSSLFWFSLIFAISVTFIGEHLVSLLYGEKYPLTGGLVRLYSWITALSYFSIVRSKLLLIEGKWGQNIFLMLSVFISNIIFNYFLIRKFQVFGAVYGTLISLGVGILLMALFENGRRIVWDWRTGILLGPKLLLDKLR